MPLVKGEAPFVQTLVDNDELGSSFDDIAGRSAGAAFSNVGGEVLKTGKDSIEIMVTTAKKEVYLFTTIFYLIERQRSTVSLL